MVTTMVFAQHRTLVLVGVSTEILSSFITCDTTISRCILNAGITDVTMKLNPNALMKRGWPSWSITPKPYPTVLADRLNYARDGIPY